MNGMRKQGRASRAVFVLVSASCALGAVPTLAQNGGTKVASTPLRPALQLAQAGDEGATKLKAGGDDSRQTSPQAALGPTLNLVTGKSTLLRLGAPVDRISVGNPVVADVTVIGSRELYVLGKAFGSTNVILWRKNGPTSVLNVVVDLDAGLLQDKLAELLPEEKGIQVHAAADSVVLSGTVSSAAKVEQAVAVADAYVRNINKALVMPIVAGSKPAQEGTSVNITQGTANVGGAVSSAGARVVNLLQVSSPQQVMLEVKIAEVSKTLLDKLGAQLRYSRTNGSWFYTLLTGFLTNSNGIYNASSGVNKSLTIDAEKKDGLIKVLAEPNIVAISGQEGSFLAGGKIFIPVARDNNNTGGTTITLEEKEFGVGLKFTPTVLDGGRINLKVAPEVSELSQTGTPFTTVNGVTAVLPSFTTRKAQTTVQLGDGQSFAIAGLIKNNITETVSRFPVLGEVPILGALFRSSEFQQDKTELVFLVTPRLVKPLTGDVPLPTDSFVPPDRSQFFLGGRMEGTAEEHKPQVQPEKKADEPSPAASPIASPASQGGFELK